ncbi:MAG: TetR/AcrR family transcriptional regulator [Candidatus Hydrogenedentes bacterium]|nr:TetR/AcrR family transcriptional regulator [Candidatus Hydrogenedentota bacterium]
MGTITAKKQEIRNREELVLEVARSLFLKRGYHGLTMARIAKAADCSKATVYQHFPCKEEIIIALTVRSVDSQHALIERAATFRGCPRERMLAVGIATLVFSRLNPDDARFFQIVGGEAITQKVSEVSIWQLRTAGLRTVNVMLGILRDAVAQGDLTLTPGHRPEDLIYNFWVLGEGGKGAQSSWLSPADWGISDPFGTILRTSHILADGYGWRPLSTEWDYEEAARRIWREVLPNEHRAVFGRPPDTTVA